jgi:hypothetical protein
VGTGAGLTAVAAAAYAVRLIRDDMAISADATERLIGASVPAAGWALVLVVVLPLAVAAAAGWRRSPRTGDLAALAGATVIGASLVHLHVAGTTSVTQMTATACGLALVVLGLLIRGPGAAGSR